jgi:hypothetical protein
MDARLLFAALSVSGIGVLSLRTPMGADHRVWLEIDETARRRFEEAWRRGRPEPIEACVRDAEESLRTATLEELVCIELEFAWRRWRESGGKAERPPPLENYLEQFPALAAPEITARLARQEFLVRRAYRSDVSPDEYLNRFPHAAHRIGFDADETESRNIPTAPPEDARGDASEPPRLGKYEILEQIGEGGMGRVYRARHVHLHSLVALKVLSSKGPTTEAALNRFQREGRAAAQLRHPHIAAALDADCDHGVFFLVFEFVDGQNLDSRVEQNGPLAAPLAMNLVRQAAEGLEFVHSRGFVHRDVKPSNLIVDGEGRVKVVDLGLVAAPDHDDRSEEWPDVTESHALLGTAAFMAPEQALDSRRADHRADIYSLGCTLFFLLTGRQIYPGRTFMERVAAHREQPIPSLKEHAPHVPDELDRVFQRMVAKSPGDRQQSMRDVIDDLDRVAACRKEAPGASGRISAKVIAAAACILTAFVLWAITRPALPVAGQPYPRQVGGQARPSSEPSPDKSIVDDVGRQILDLGGWFEADLNGDKIKVSAASQAPTGPYKITAVNLSDVAQVTDQRLLDLLPHLPDCDCLYLDNCSVTGNGIQAIAYHVPDLRTLNASGLEFDDDDARALATFTNLESLYLVNVPVGDATARLLSEISSLEYLFLGGTQIGNEGLAALARLPKLKSLGIGATRVTSDGLHPLTQMNLRHLWLDRSTIGDEAIETLAQCRTLEALGLEYSRFTEQGVLELSRRLPECKITD